MEMLFRCNYLALIGGGSRPAFPNNKGQIMECLISLSCYFNTTYIVLCERTYIYSMCTCMYEHIMFIRIEPWVFISHK